MRSASTIRLTDITAHFAFLQMENLEKLHLDFFPVKIIHISFSAKLSLTGLQLNIYFVL